MPFKQIPMLVGFLYTDVLNGWMLGDVRDMSLLVVAGWLATGVEGPARTS